MPKPLLEFEKVPGLTTKLSLTGCSRRVGWGLIANNLMVTGKGQIGRVSFVKLPIRQWGNIVLVYISQRKLTGVYLDFQDVFLMEIRYNYSTTSEFS